MATKASIKTKLQNLINAGNEATGKQDVDLTTVVSSLIEGYGQGGTDTSDATATSFDILKDKTAYVDGVKVVGAIPTYAGENASGVIEVCAGSHIIEVTELPTENINEDDIYKLSFDFRDVILTFGSMLLSFAEAKEAGEAVTFNTIPTKTTEGIKITDEELHFYYIEDENNVFLYGDIDDTGVNDWVTMEELFGEVIFGGLIANASQAVYSNSTLYYFIVCGTSYYQYIAPTPHFTDIILQDGGYSTSIKEYYKAGGIPVYFIYEETRPITGVLASTNQILYMYYVQDENSVLTYDETNGWEGEDVTVITDANQATADGWYAVISEGEGWLMLIPENEVTTEVPTTEEKTVTPTKSTQTVTPSDADYLSKVTVNPIPDSYVIPSLQSKTVKTTKNGTTTITPDSGYTGLSKVVTTTKIPTVYRISAMEDLPTDAIDGSVAIIWG